MSRTLGVRCLAWGFLLSFAGCVGDGLDMGEVEGTVTLDGTPLPYATVEFIPNNGRPSANRTDHQGHYRLRYTASRTGALVGSHLVTVSTVRDPNEVVDSTGKRLPSLGEQVHPRYNRDARDNPEMRVEVKLGKNVINLDLKSK